MYQVKALRSIRRSPCEREVSTSCGDEFIVGSRRSASRSENVTRTVFPECGGTWTCHRCLAVMETNRSCCDSCQHRKCESCW